MGEPNWRTRTIWFERTENRIWHATIQTREGPIVGMGITAELARRELQELLRYWDAAKPAMKLQIR